MQKSPSRQLRQICWNGLPESRLTHRLSRIASHHIHSMHKALHLGKCQPPFCPKSSGLACGTV